MKIIKFTIAAFACFLLNACVIDKQPSMYSSQQTSNSGYVSTYNGSVTSGYNRNYQTNGVYSSQNNATNGPGSTTTTITTKSPVPRPPESMSANGMTSSQSY